MDQGSPEERRLAAIVFTDMVGYSALAQRNEAVALQLLGEHRRVVRAVLPGHQGIEVKTTGDGFLLEFASALSAVQCAVEIQQVLAGCNQSRPPEWQARIRIGIHLGDVVRKEGDVFGDGVNIAARIEPLAESGGICVSRAVYEQVQNKLDLEFARLDAPWLKNIDTDVEVYRAILSAGPLDEHPSRQRAAGQRSIAVLPFANMSADQENEFLSDGIAEDLITALSRLGRLRVPARTSSFVFKGKNEDVRRIGQVLNVETVLEGSVRKSGSRLRIAAQLIKVADGFHLWSERYDREMKDVFDIQDDITRAIVDALQVQLGTAPDAPLVKEQTASAEAYQLYLKGREQFKRRGVGLKKALHYFELSLLEDPNYARAHSGVADAYSLLAFYDLLPYREALAKAKAAAERALALDDQLAEAHGSRAFVTLLDEWDIAVAEKGFLRAVELDPSVATPRAWYATWLGWIGRSEEAIVQHQRLIDAEPMAPQSHALYGWTLLGSGQYEAALPVLQHCVELAPESALGHYLLGRTCLALDQPEKALTELEIAARLSGRDPHMLSGFAHALAAAGRRGPAEEILEELLSRTPETPVRSIYVAVVHAALGQNEQALACLEQAWEERDFWLLFLRGIPPLDGLRDEPQFAELMGRVQAEVEAIGKRGDAREGR
jgi:adenylate cyclase